MESKNPKLPIPLNSISEEGLSLFFNEGSEELKKELPSYVTSKPFEVKASIHPVGPHYEMKGEIEATADLNCSLCTEEFERKIKEKFQEILAPEWAKKMAKSDTIKDFIESEVEVISGLKGEEFYLGEYLNEFIEFNLSPHPKCKEDCKGLCQECGANLNYEACECDKTKHKGHIGFKALKNLKIDNQH